MKLDIETVKADFFDATALKEPPYKLYRTNVGGQRYYYTKEDGNVVLYPSATTITKAVLPTSPYLISWISSMGEEQAKKYCQMRAHYGTIMHMLFSDFLIREEFYLDDIKSDVEVYSEANGIVPEKGWVEDLKQDIIGFAQFCYDYDVEPIAIEIPLKCDSLGIACTVDLIARVTVKEKGFWGERYKSGPRKGEPKETSIRQQKVAIIDYKSGRGGSYLDNEVQLALNKYTAIENFADLTENILLWNYHPKDWRTEPKYGLNDQTGKHSFPVIDHIVSLYEHYRGNKDKVITTYGGIIEVGSSPDGTYQKQLLIEALNGTNK